MKFLQLVDFDKTQHYKDRTPPWIKLHRDILHKREFLKLEEAERYHYVALQIIASECENRIPLDPKWIQGRLSIKGKPAIQAIIKAGLARIVDDGRNGASSGTSHEPSKETIPHPATSEEAWNVAVDYHYRYASETGVGGWTYGAPELPEEITAAVRAIGDWDRVANLRKNPRDLPFARKEFLAAIKNGVIK